VPANISMRCAGIKNCSHPTLSLIGSSPFGESGQCSSQNGVINFDDGDGSASPKVLVATA
jgi:hypothetical protein